MISSQIRTTGEVFVPGRREAELRQAVKGQFIKASEFLIGEFTRVTPVGATGYLRKGWTYRYNDLSQAAVISPQAEYASAVELGRKAAPCPSKPLELWVKRVLGVSNAKSKTIDGNTVLGYRAIAYLIARKKRKQATPGQFFATKAFDAAVPALNTGFITPMVGLIVSRLGE